MVARVKEEELHLSVVNCFSLRKAVKRKLLDHPFERKSTNPMPFLEVSFKVV